MPKRRTRPLTEEERKARQSAYAKKSRERRHARMGREAALAQEKAWRDAWYERNPNYTKERRRIQKLEKSAKEKNRQRAQAKRDRDGAMGTEERRLYQQEYRNTERGREATNRAQRRYYRKQRLSPEELAMLERDAIRKEEIEQELAEIKVRELRLLGS